MHLPYPPRKSSNPPPFRPRTAKLPTIRRARLKTIGLGLVFFIGVFYLLFGPSNKNPYHERRPAGYPHVVLVTVLDTQNYNDKYLETVRENREEYAKRHGYQPFVVKSNDYDTKGAPVTWTKLIALRHAISKYPDCKYLWYLEQDAYIMDPKKSLDDIVMQSSKLESMMLRGKPVVPPDSIIRTFDHLRADDIDLVLSQDKSGLVHNNIILRNGEWAKFLLETWLDPLYRSYNFQKAERHALEHIVQWHATILSKLALVPQRTFSSYTHATLGETGGGYQPGDFVAMFHGCTKVGRDSCEVESGKYWEKWKAAFSKA